MFLNRFSYFQHVTLMQARRAYFVYAVLERPGEAKNPFRLLFWGGSEKNRGAEFVFHSSQRGLAARANHQRHADVRLWRCDRRLEIGAYEREGERNRDLGLPQAGQKNKQKTVIRMNVYLLRKFEKTKLGFNIWAVILYFNSIFRICLCVSV